MSTTKSKDRVAAEKRKHAQGLISGFRGIAIFLFGMSGVINLLALTGSLYMLQIYDRALGSGSIPTLLALSALAVGLYLFQGMLEILRSQILIRIGARLDRKIAPMAHQVAIDMPRYGYSTSEALDRGRDVDTLRGFLGSQGPVALFDLPWMPVFLIFAYILHPLLGALTLGGAFVLAMIAIATELLTRQVSNSAHHAAITRNEIADSNARNADVLKAMGMSGRAIKRFNSANEDHLDLQTRTSDVSGSLGALSRILRMILQSAVLGLGAYLTIIGELSAGAIIAASVASGRALAPIDMAIGNWKQVVHARGAYARLRETIVTLASAVKPMPLPSPKAGLRVEGITVAAPSSGRILLSDISFELLAGQGLGIIGQSGGGKTTLVRALTGVWPCVRGGVRLDGADMSQWDPEALGRHVGYLPQDVALMGTTVEQNISRLEDNADPGAVVAAAMAAGVHEMIVRLPEGYQTNLGAAGMALSAGQRQRIGLARALYGNPFLVILDEPNSNLDSEGEAALSVAIKAVRDRGGIVIVVAHRPSALAAVNFVAVVQNGKLTSFGPKEEIIGLKSQPAAPAPVEMPRRAVGGPS